MKDRKNRNETKYGEDERKEAMTEGQGRKFDGIDHMHNRRRANAQQREDHHKNLKWAEGDHT